MCLSPSGAAFLVLSATALAQTGDRPEFEVASVKPSATALKGLPGGRIQIAPGGTLNVINMTLKELVAYAWKIHNFQISGGPPWIDSERYDISAKPEHASTQTDIVPMLQSLLANRFQLTIHRETKELPVYALVIAKKDGKLGPSLTQSNESNCTKPAPPGVARPLCGMMRMSPRGSLKAVSLPLSSLTTTLAQILGRPVVDHTGLSGNFDMNLDWTPDESQAMQVPPGTPTPPHSDAPPPSIFTALQEQLGLKLESRKGPVETIVIDRAEKPSEN